MIKLILLSAAIRAAWAGPALEELRAAAGSPGVAAPSPVETRTCGDFLAASAKSYEAHRARRIAAVEPRLPRLIANARRFHQAVGDDARRSLGPILDALAEAAALPDRERAQSLGSYWLKKAREVLDPIYASVAPFARSGECRAGFRWNAPASFFNAPNSLDGYCSRGVSPDGEFRVPEALWSLYWGYSQTLGSGNRRALIGAACYGDFRDAYMFDDRRLLEPACVLFDLESPTFTPVGKTAEAALFHSAFKEDIPGIVPMPTVEEWQGRRAKEEGLGFCVGEEKK